MENTPPNVQRKSFAAHKTAAENAFFWHNSDAAFPALSSAGHVPMTYITEPTGKPA
jgi:hypothetical protein